MKYDGYLIYTDLDGTLLDKNGDVSAKNKKAIEKFQKEGGKFAYATGRSFEFTKKFPVKANAPLICVGGTRVYDTKSGEEIFSFPIGKEGYEALKYADDNYKGVSEAYVFENDGRTVCGMSEAAQVTKKIYKVVFVFGKESDALAFQADMADKFRDLVFERSWNVGVEMLSKNGGKGLSVNAVRNMYNDEKLKIICIGDYENDISMLKAADVGVAVKNALDCVKAEADVVAPGNDEDAIAWLVENTEKLERVYDKKIHR